MTVRIVIDPHHGTGTMLTYQAIRGDYRRIDMISEDERTVNTNDVVFGDTFYDEPISKYGRDNHRVDYGAFASVFNAVMCNGILNSTKGEWEQISGFCDDDEYSKEIFQFFIIDTRGAVLVQDFTNDPLFYNEELDMYVWGITFGGIDWEYALTSIPCK